MCAKNPRKPLMHGKKLLPIAPKIAPENAPEGFSISREGIFSKLIKKSSPKRPPARRAKPPRSGARAQAGGEAPATGSNAPAPSVPAPTLAPAPATGINAPAPSIPAPTPAPFVAGNPPLCLSSTSPGADTVSGMPLEMPWPKGLGPDSSLAYEQLDMQASYHMFGTVDALHQGPYEPPQMSSSISHQISTGGYRFDPPFLQTAGAQYDSASIQPYPAYTPFDLGEDGPRIQPYPAEPFPFYGSAPSAIQPQAGAWGTEPSGNMPGAPVSFAQQVPTSVTTHVHNHDNWGGYNGAMDRLGSSNDQPPAPTPPRHSQVLQQSAVVAVSEPSFPLTHACSRKRRRDTAVANPGNINGGDEEDADGSTDDEGRALRYRGNGHEQVQEGIWIGQNIVGAHT